MLSAPVAKTAMDKTAIGEIDLGDVKMPVAITGDGPPLVLLHGWTLDHRMWQPQLAQLGERYRLIMPDRRGFGLSNAAADLNAETQDIVRLVDALGHDRFVLAGLSQGAAVALAFAVRHPDHLVALALAGTPLPGLVANPDLVPREHYAALVGQGKIADMRKEWLGHDLMRVSSREGQRLLEAIVGDYDGRDLLSPTALPIFKAAQIEKLSMPLLAIAGSRESPWRDACARFLATCAPQGEYVSIADAGHIANVDQPSTFNAALLEFLAAHPQIPA